MDPLVRMKLREQWFWCPDFASRTNLKVCRDRVQRKRPYSPCNACTLWSRKVKVAYPAETQAAPLP